MPKPIRPGPRSRGPFIGLTQPSKLDNVLLTDPDSDDSWWAASQLNISTVVKAGAAAVLALSVSIAGSFSFNDEILPEVDIASDFSDTSISAQRLVYGTDLKQWEFTEEFVSQALGIEEEYWTAPQPTLAAPVLNYVQFSDEVVTSTIEEEYWASPQPVLPIPVLRYFEFSDEVFTVVVEEEYWTVPQPALSGSVLNYFWFNDEVAQTAATLNVEEEYWLAPRPALPSPALNYFWFNDEVTQTAATLNIEEEYWLAPQPALPILVLRYFEFNDEIFTALNVEEEYWLAPQPALATPILSYFSFNDEVTQAAATLSVAEDYWSNLWLELPPPRLLQFWFDDEIVPNATAVISDFSDSSISPQRLIYTSTFKHWDFTDELVPFPLSFEDEYWLAPQPALPIPALRYFWFNDEITQAAPTLNVEDEYWLAPQPALPVPALYYFWFNDEVTQPVAPLGVEDEYWLAPPPALPTPVLRYFQFGDEVFPSVVEEEYWLDLKPVPSITVVSRFWFNDDLKSNVILNSSFPDLSVNAQRLIYTSTLKQWEFIDDFVPAPISVEEEYWLAPQPALPIPALRYFQLDDEITQPVAPLNVDDEYWIAPKLELPSSVLRYFWFNDEVALQVAKFSVDTSGFTSRPAYEQRLTLWQISEELPQPAIPLNVEDEYWLAPQPALPVPTLRYFWFNDEITQPAIPLLVDEMYWQSLTSYPGKLVVTTWRVEDENLKLFTLDPQDSLLIITVGNDLLPRVFSNDDDTFIPVVPLRVNDDYWQVFTPAPPTPLVTLWQVLDEITQPAPLFGTDEDFWQVYTPALPKAIFSVWQSEEDRPVPLPGDEDYWQVYTPALPKAIFGVWQVEDEWPTAAVALTVDEVYSAPVQIVPSVKVYLLAQITTEELPTVLYIDGSDSWIVMALGNDVCAKIYTSEDELPRRPIDEDYWQNFATFNNKSYTGAFISDEEITTQNLQLFGNTLAVSSVNANLTTNIEVNSVAQATATTTANLTTSVSLVSSVAALTSIGSSVITANIRFSCLVGGIASATASLTTFTRFNSLASCVVNTVPNLTASIRCNSLVNGIASTTADLTTAIKLNSTVSSVSSFTGFFGPPSLFGFVFISVEANADISIPKPLEGNIQALSSVQVADFAGNIGIFGTAQASSRIVRAHLSKRKPDDRFTVKRRVTRRVETSAIKPTIIKKK